MGRKWKNNRKGRLFKRLVKLYSRSTGLTDKQLEDMKNTSEARVTKITTLLKPDIVQNLYMLNSTIEFVCANVAAAQLEGIADLSTENVVEHIKVVIEDYKKQAMER